MIARSEVRLDRNLIERDVISKEIEQIPMPAQFDELWVIAEENDGGRLHRHLRGVKDLETAVSPHGWILFRNRGFHEPIQFAGRDSLFRLIEE